MPPPAGERTSDPGPYRLRLILSDGTAFERALYVSPGQQTQVFLMRADYALADGGVERRADLAGGGVVISPSQVFQPDDGRTRLAELARYALAQKRRALSDEVINDILDEKGEDPMLGLLGAHLLLRDEPENRSFFETVIRNLLRLLGPEHPDVHALRLRARPPPPPAPLSSAPMLRASWDLAAVDPHTAEVIPETGPTGVIATRILPSAPWLVWSAGAAAGTAQDRAEVLLELLGDFMKARDRTLSPEPATSGFRFGSGILEGLRSAVSGAAGALRGIDILASGKSFGLQPSAVERLHADDAVLASEDQLRLRGRTRTSRRPSRNPRRRSTIARRRNSPARLACPVTSSRIC